MNTKVVPCDILNMFKVLLRLHKHFIHWLQVNPSICKATKWQHMQYKPTPRSYLRCSCSWMLNDACAHAMPMPNACLTPGCYSPSPLIEILSWYWKDLPILVESGVGVTQKIVPFPCCILFTMVVPHHFIELNHLTSSYSLHLFYHLDRFFFIRQIRLDLDISGFNGFFGHTKTFLQLRDVENIEDGAHL